MDNGNKLLQAAALVTSALKLLEDVADQCDEAPFPEFFKRYYLLTGDHMVLTEEGWIPAELNTLEHTGAEPMETFDEVNAPQPAS